MTEPKPLSPEEEASLRRQVDADYEVGVSSDYSAGQVRRLLATLDAERAARPEATSTASDAAWANLRSQPAPDGPRPINFDDGDCGDGDCPSFGVAHTHNAGFWANPHLAPQPAPSAPAPALDAERLHEAMRRALPSSYGTGYAQDERREVEAIAREYAALGNPPVKDPAHPGASQGSLTPGARP